ncbi:hypothetical protein, conserved [Plasmodium ovale wallikeri]|uniref:Uncharacterized protein n=1 Tax=Plasmodium ovale wallikeri TaxID=864142 RepID=A0A1A8ZBZ4_PLAOA|nr:hypothetical protein, conserved [Plasmodium ovale wallikeri]
MHNPAAVKIAEVLNGYAKNLVKKRRFNSGNFEYSSAVAVFRYEDRPIVREEKSTNDTRDDGRSAKGRVRFPYRNDDFFELVKKTFREKKNDLTLWGNYCRETMYRINERNIHPKIITSVLTFISYTDYRNDRIMSEIINRCILRLNEFDIVNICSLVSSLSKMNISSTYFMEETKKKLMKQEDAYFEKYSPHYVCLLINSILKLQCHNDSDIYEEYKELVSFLLQKISNRKESDFSLLGISLLLHNIAKLRLKNYYYFFNRFESHIVKNRNDFNVIQILNILIAYEKVSFLKLYFLEELLSSLLQKKKIFTCTVHNLVRFIKIVFSFLSKREKITQSYYPDDNIKRVKEICAHIFFYMYKRLDECKRKEDLVLLCSVLSTYKKLIKNKDKGNIFLQLYSPFFCMIESNDLFKKITLNVKMHISRCNSTELSILFYCYSSYQMYDSLLFYFIKLRCFKIFSTFNEISFSYLFKASQNMNRQDDVFQNSCLNKISQIGKYTSIRHFCITLSAYTSVRGEKQSAHIAQLLLANFEKILSRMGEASCGGSNGGAVDTGGVVDRGGANDGDHTDDTGGDSRVSADTISAIVFFFSKMKHVNITHLINMLVYHFPHYKHDLSTESCIRMLISLSNLCANIKTEESKKYWKGYYSMVNFLAKKILVSTDLYQSKHLIMLFLKGCGKIFPSANSVRISGKRTFYFKSVLNSLLPCVHKQMCKLTVEEMAILTESLSKENYSREAIDSVLSKGSYDAFAGALLERCKEVLGDTTECVDNSDGNGRSDSSSGSSSGSNGSSGSSGSKSAMIIVNNLTRLEVHDESLFHVVVNNRILECFFLSSISALSQGIYYICMHLFCKVQAVTTGETFLLRFLLKRLYELLVNEGVIILTRNYDEIISYKHLDNLSKDCLFFKSMKCVCEAVLVILFHMCHLNYNRMRHFLEAGNYSSNSNVNRVHLLGSINLLCLYLAIFKIAEHVRQKKGCHVNEKDVLNVVTVEIHQTVRDMQIRSDQAPLLFFNVLALRASAAKRRKKNEARGRVSGHWGHRGSN